jgi:curli biogenesis system outer membrane secretion channel CsgG
MMMKTGKQFVCVLTALLVAGTTFAQRKVVAVAKVKVAPSVETAAKQAGSDVSLQRVVDAIDGQTIDSLNGTRKFEVVARSDMDALLEEGGLTGQAVQPGEADYLIVPSVDDFQDYIERASFGGIGKVAEKRKIRLGMVARIYDVKNGGKLVESANFQLDNKNIQELMTQSARSGMFSDELLRQIAEEMGSQVANRVVDVIYPARIIALTGPQATVNRGDGTGIAVGQNWDVFALGEEMIDPDTGESLGSSEVKVGTLRIDRVTPKFSSGTLTENFGVVKGSIVRVSN